MKNVVQVSVDDEFAVGFSSIYNKKMVVAFESYFDCENNSYCKAPCQLIVENWSNAEARTHGTTKYQPLEDLLGIVWMVLWIEEHTNILKMVVQTCDERYLELKFENATAGYIFTAFE
jgi:hypothetical protein